MMSCTYRFFSLSAVINLSLVGCSFFIAITRSIISSGTVLSFFSPLLLVYPLLPFLLASVILVSKGGSAHLHHRLHRYLYALCRQIILDLRFSRRKSSIAINDNIPLPPFSLPWFFTPSTNHQKITPYPFSIRQNNNLPTRHVKRHLLITYN